MQNDGALARDVLSAAVQGLQDAVEHSMSEDEMCLVDVLHQAQASVQGRNGAERALAGEVQEHLTVLACWYWSGWTILGCDDAFESILRVYPHWMENLNHYGSNDQDVRGIVRAAGAIAVQWPDLGLRIADLVIHGPRQDQAST